MVKSATRVARPPCPRRRAAALSLRGGLVVAIMGNVGAEEAVMSARKTFLSWPVVRQLTGDDPLGRGPAVTSARTGVPRAPHDDRRPGRPERLPLLRRRLRPAGLRQGRARSSRSRATPTRPISRGRLCPKGSASEQLVNHPGRQTAMLYRRPYGTEWEPLDLETATDMIADRVVDTRAPHLAGHATSTGVRCAARWASPASAGRPSTTKRTT